MLDVGSRTGAILYGVRLRCSYRWGSGKNRIVLFSSRKWRRIQIATCTSEADPGFLKLGFICIKVWGLALPLLSNF